MCPIALCAGTMCNYYLNESKGWRLETAELERSIAAAKAAGRRVRAIVVINPGNPTGNCLSEENVREVVAFASKHKLLLLADEVYQDNVWSEGCKWVAVTWMDCAWHRRRCGWRKE